MTRASGLILPGLIVLAFLAASSLRVAAQQREVDVELVLAVDVSRSMNPAELEIQRQGYAAALTDRQVLDAMLSGMIGRVAITYLEWAGDGNQMIVVPWREVASEADAKAFADALLARPALSMRYTSISGAILTGMRLLENNGFDGLKRVIDVSGDGPNNQGVPVEEARDLAVANGIIINGLPLMTAADEYSRFSIPHLDRYYADCVIGGPASFSFPVRSWQEFPEAVRRKLILELATLPAQPDWKLPDGGAGPVVRIADTGKTDCLIGERLRLQWDNP